MRLSRAEAAAELGARWTPGDHLTLIGPTGRGKSTLLAQVIPHAQHDRVVILCPKGADPAFAALGYGTDKWPPRRSWRDDMRTVFTGDRGEDRHAARPIVWRVERELRRASDLDLMAPVFAAVLGSSLARPQSPPPPDSLAVILDDSRMISDHLGLSKLVVANMLVARSKRVSIVNSYQAPRWVPREGLDQGTQIIMWRNRDKDVRGRLAEIGDLDPRAIEAAMRDLEYHEALWIDGRSDDLFVIGQ